MDELNKALDATKEGAVCLSKLQDLLQNMFGPRWTRKQADADAYADQQKLDTIRNNPDMKIEYIGGVMNARKCTDEELALRAEQRQKLNCIRQEKNIENVIYNAAEELSHQQDVPAEEPIDDDWITRFFNVVKDISAEDMQIIWGKILAGEVCKPGSFSLRTLEAIKNISENEAKTFQRALSLVIRTIANSRSFIYSSNDILSKYGVSYSDILLLDECGLLNSSGLINQYITIKPGTDTCVYNKEYLILLSNRDSEKPAEISFGIYSLTKVAEDLLQILVPSTAKDYLIDVAEDISKNNKEKEVVVSVNQITGFREDCIDYKNDPIRSFSTERLS